MFNQNYHPAWRTDDGPLMNFKGRLAVDLVRTGEYPVVLRYEPVSVYFGLAVSVMSLVALGVWIVLARPVRVTTWLCGSMRTHTVAWWEVALLALVLVGTLAGVWFVWLQTDIQADYLFDYGNLRTEEKRLDEAVKAFKKAAKLRPDHPLVHRELGLCYVVQGRWVEAIAQFSRGLEFHPGDTDLRNLLSSAYCTVERYDDAIRESQAVLEREPLSPRAHLTLALCHAMEGRRGQALDALTRAIEVGYTDFAYLERTPPLRDLLADDALAALIRRRR
jgi:hypothetical protein